MKRLFIRLFSACCFGSLQRILGTLLFCWALDNHAQAAEAITNQTSQQIRDTGEAALNKIEVLWQRIDERRLKNRTPDELVAWVLMGLLAGGLLYRITRQTQLATILVGLIGSFVGGIVANVFQLNFGMGPVLVRYEDLLCSIVGAVLVLLGWRWIMARAEHK